MSDLTTEERETTTPKSGGKAADTDKVTWRHGHDDVTHTLDHGRLVLGDEEGEIEETEDGENIKLRTGQRSMYVTKYRIDHEAEMRGSSSGVAFHQCTPCFTCGTMGKQKRLVAWVWYFLASKLLLFTVHLATIVFGVAKEALDMRHSEYMKGLHIAHSLVEIFFTLFIIILHMLNAHMGYVIVRQAVQRLERFDLDKDKSLRSIKTWMWLLVVAGFVHIVVSVSCFVAFHVFLHLGWTVLSNQTCILSMNALFGLYSSLMMTTTVKIKEDQQQVVIQEALMLLKQRCRDDDSATCTAATTTSSKETAEMFIEAVSNTTSLTRPKYINITSSNPTSTSDSKEH